MSNVNKLVDRLTDRIPYLLLKTSKLLSLYTSKRKTSQGMVKKVCRYNGQLVQVQWTFGQNHEIILSTVLAFDCSSRGLQPRHVSCLALICLRVGYTNFPIRLLKNRPVVVNSSFLCKLAKSNFWRNQNYSLPLWET